MTIFNLNHSFVLSRLLMTAKTSYCEQRVWVLEADKHKKEGFFKQASLSLKNLSLPFSISLIHSIILIRSANIYTIILHQLNVMFLYTCPSRFRFLPDMSRTIAEATMLYISMATYRNCWKKYCNFCMNFTTDDVWFSNAK